MTITFRNALLKDLDRIMAIEHAAFSKEEAASRTAMRERIIMIRDTFIVATDTEDRPVGYVVGPVIEERCLYDDLFDKTVKNPQIGGYQSILSLAVGENHQKQGLASKLLMALADTARTHKRKGVTLTCLEGLIPFYQKQGYVLQGVSASQHAGEIWYDMVLDL